MSRMSILVLLTGLGFGGLAGACSDNAADASWGGEPDSGEAATAADVGTKLDATFDMVSPVGDAGGGGDASDEWPTGPDIPEGGLPPNPGFVACGNSSCDLATEFCCTPSYPQQNTPTCMALEAGITCDIMPGTRLLCDEPADCPAGQLCCLQKSTGIIDYYTSSCHQPLDCYAPGSQMCRKNSDCFHLGPCTPYQCGTDFLETCAALPQAACH